MTHVPVPQLPSPREEVIEILARGLCELVMRGCKPDQPKNKRHPVFWGPSPPSQLGRESTTCPARRQIASSDINQDRHLRRLRRVPECALWLRAGLIEGGSDEPR